MGGIFSPKQSASPITMPPPPPPLPPAAIPPTVSNPTVQKAQSNQKTAAALAAGKGNDSTVATSMQGDLVPPNTAKASLVG